MRHETCLNCLAGTTRDQRVQAVILASETISGLAHHHHTVNCGGCGRWWFDDIVLGGLGIPVALRRDTEMCGCEDSLPQYTVSAVIVPQPDDQCSCTKAETERFALPIRMRSAQ
jgi:hypothetical protein